MPVTKKHNYRGMSMGARMLLFSSLFLFALPWLGYRYIDEMKDFLLQGQEDAQLMAARALATVLHGHADLFYPLDGPADFSIDTSALYVYPLEAPIEVDGYSGDWDSLLQQAKNFGAESIVYDRSGGTTEPVTFSLLLGEYKDTVYALVRVLDQNIVYRHPKYRRLDHSDHVRLELISPNGDNRRIIFIAEGQGQVSVYDMKPDWKTPVSGQPIYTISGIWRERSDGYYLELRLPASKIGTPPRMMISVASVDRPYERKLDSIVATSVNDTARTPNYLITRSQQLDRILQGLGSAESGVCVVDKHRRVRGVFGGDKDTALCLRKDRVRGELVDASLEGDARVLRYQDDVGESVIVAAHPVYANNEVLGVVLVEKNSSHILGLQRESLLQIIIATLIVFVAAIVGLMLFAAWLAYRIRRLQREASHAIDADGRVVAEHLTTDQYAADEIGQLSRDFSSLLSRLKSYTGFLESVPRTLRHEILNPVNTISMSLQKMGTGNVNESLVNSASKATRQLEMIVQGLTEAAHIEDALALDNHERFDIAAMVKEYVENTALKHGRGRIKYHGPDSGVYMLGSDLLVVQLLDKLKDNALDFSDDNSVIVIELEQKESNVVLCVVNKGPAIPQEILELLFVGMISSRQDRDDRPHLGIGLYIANRIAQQHGGVLNIANLTDSNAVKVSLVLPVNA